LDPTHQMQLYRRKSEDLQIEKLLAGSKRPRGIHCTTIIARHALSPSTPRACGATLRASGVDCSARPSKEGYHAMNADTCLVLLTPDQFG
jgi:hypothetical protein